MRAVQLTAFGNPGDGLEYVDIPEPDAPGPNQVLIGVEFSPINPSDLMVAKGIYAYRPPLRRCHFVERRTREFCVPNIFKRPRLPRATCS